MTRLITLVMGMMVLAFTAFATPNPMTAPVNNLAFNAENSFNGLAVSSSKVDVSSETNGRLNSLIATTSLVAHSTNSNNALADVTFSVSSPTADVGDQVCVDFSVTGFTDIVSIQYSMNWDATKLDYVASQNYNLTDLNAAAFGTAGTSNGDLTLSWFHNATTGVTLPDGAVIYQVCFDVLADAEGQSVAVGLSGTPTSIEVTDNTFAVQNFINEDGAVIVSGTPPPPPASGITFNVSSSTADAGTQTCLDVSVDGFTDIVSFQYSMNWDENILGYASVQNFNLTDLNAAAFGTSGTANGDLTASWIHQATTGVTVPDGTVIYQVCFDVLAGTEGETAAVSLSGAPTSIEVTNNTNAVVDFSNNNGQVSVNGTPPPPSSGVTFNVSSSTVDAGDETCLNVSVEGFTNIVSFQYSMNWDENILGYSTVESFNLTDLNAAAFGTSGTANGDLTASWIHQATTGVTVPDGTVIYKVCFDALAGTEGQTAAVSLSGSPTSIEVTDTTSGVVDFSNNNGQVSVNGTPPPPSSGVTFNVSSSTVDAGDQTCLDVSVEGFTDIVSFQYSMNWDENILGYASVQNFNLTDLNAAAFGTSGTANGDLTASWIHQATTGVTVPDGTVIYQVCFDALSGTDGQTATIGLSGSPTSIEVTDNTSSVVDFSNNAGQVSVNDNGGGQNSSDLSFIVEEVTGENGEQVCMDISVEGFNDIVSAQYSMNWDASVLTFASVQNYNLTDLNAAAFGTSGTAAGNLTLSWIHQATTGVTVPDGTVIYQVCFDVNGTDGETVGVSISGSPTSIEVTDNTSSVITPIIDNGQVTVQGDNGGGTGNGNLTFTVEDVEGEEGEMICLDVTVDNFTDVVSAQYSMNWDPTELQFNGVQNYNLTDLNEAAFGTNGTDNGDLTMSWIHQATTGVTVPDGTVIYQVCFTVLSGVGSTPLVSFSGAPTSIEITDNTSSVIPFFSNPGQVTIVTGSGGGNDDLEFTMQTAVVEIGESFCLDVTVDNFNAIVSAQYSINWDPTVLSFTGVQGFNLTDLNASSFGTTGTANGNLTSSWFHQATTGITLPTGTVIYQVCFEALTTTGSTNISFSGSPTSIETTTINNQIVPFTSVPGVVIIEGSDTNGPTQDNANLTFTIESETAETGDNICLDISVDDFVDIVSFQYSMVWDESILDFTGLQAFNLEDLNEPDFGQGSIDDGILTVSWIHEATTGVTVPNGTVIYQACFDVIGASGSISQVAIGGTPTSIEVTSNTSNGQDIDAEFNAGNVSVEGEVVTEDVVFQYECVDGEPGDIVCIPVSTQNFTNISSFQYSMHWNDDILSYQSVQAFGIPFLAQASFGEGNAANGSLGVVWTNDEGLGTSVPNGDVLFEICFEIIGDVGQSTLMTFDGFPTAVEVTDVSAAELPVTFLQCAVNVVNNCPAATITQNSISNVSCQGGNNGLIEVTVSGGDDAYTYQWIDNSSNGILSLSEDIGGLPAGNYTLNVTTCGGAETASQTFQVTEPNTSISISETVGTVTCFEGQDGTISVTGQGGTGSLTYNWTGGNLPANTTGTNLSGLMASTYSLTVTDANQCTMNEAFTVEQPASQLSLDATVTDVSCNGNTDGAIAITATGGWGNYSYAWTGGLSGTNPQNLAAGMYTVTVEDQEGCEMVDELEVNQPANVVIAGTTTDVATDSPGAINITPGGGSGTGTYTYQWTGPDNYSAITEDLNNLSIGGQYCVTVTDANNCTDTQCFTINSPLIVEIDEVQFSCADESNGFINISTFGGQGTITYSWTGPGPYISDDEDINGLAGGTYIVLVTDGNGSFDTATVELTEAASAISVSPVVSQLSDDGVCDGVINVSGATGGFGGYTFLWNTVDAATTSTVTNLCAGDYTVTITDSEGCSTTSTTTIEYIPVELVADATTTSTSCFGECNGSVTVDILTGVAPYTIEIKDAAGITIASGTDLGNDGTETFGNLCAQSVLVLITDDAGQTMEIPSQVIDEPAPLTIVSSTIFPVTIAAGNNGAISVNVEGGTGEYEYDWSPGSNDQTNVNLSVGAYSVEVTDENGCSMTSEIFQLQLFEVSALDIDDADCVGDTNGEACATVAGGNGDYTYLWSSGEMTNCISEKEAGNYTVTITDVVSGVSISQEVNIETQSFLTATAAPSTLFVGGANVSCAGRSDGAATANSQGGMNDVSYVWNDSNNTNSQAISNVPAGVYTVTATDEIGCISTASVTITEPEPFSTTLEIDGISCNGQRDGAITAVPTGGANTDVAEYDYEWTGTGIVNAFLPTVSNLTEGLYTVNITDPNGCETTGTTELFEPEILEVTAVTTADDGSQNGTATAIVTGGTEDYSYEWRSNGEVGTTEELTGLAAGSYMLFVTDANGCEAMEMDIIVQDNSLGCLDTRLVITPFSSPGENDEFVINCIENYEENRLEIYNRWGQLVYTQENYDCGTDDCPNGWKGTNLRDAELAGGGYFYVLEYEEQGVTKQLKGSITILKE